MSTINRVIKNTGFLYVKMGITMFISLYTTRLILNSLGTSDFGIFNIVGGTIAMLSFLNAGMANATQRFMSYSEGEGNKEKQKIIFNISLILHFGIAIVMAITLLIAGWFFFNGILKIDPERIFAAKVVYGSLIISTIFTIMTVPYDAVLNARENMLYYSIVGIIESILKLVVALAIVYYTSGDKLILYGVLMAIIPLITMSIMRVYCHKHYEECVIKPNKYWDNNLVKEIGSFAGWNMLGTMTTVVSTFGIGIFINFFHGTISNAAQGISTQISGQLGVLGTSIKKALNPIIAKSAGANDHSLMINSTIFGTKIIFFVVAICFLPFMIEMPFILKIWLIKPPAEVEIFCWLLLLTNLIDQLVLFLPQAILAIGKIRNYQIIISILSFFPIVISAVAFKHGAPAYSIYAITAIVAIFKNIIIIFFAKKICNIKVKNYLINVIARCIFSFAIILLLGNILRDLLNLGFMRLIIVTIFTSCTYILSFIFIGLNRKERHITLQKLFQFQSQLFHKIKIFYE